MRFRMPLKSISIVSLSIWIVVSGVQSLDSLFYDTVNRSTRQIARSITF